MPGEGITALHVAFVAAALLGAFSLVVMVQVLWIAQAGARRQRRRDAFQERWRPLLAAASLGMDDAGMAVPQGDREKRWWLQLWTRMQATLRGRAHERLNRLLCELQLDRHAVELLARRDIRAQLVALACFRQLGDPGYWQVVEPVLQARNPVKAVAAADALVTIDPARAMRQVLPVAVSGAGWGRHQLAWLCKRAGPGAVTPPLLDLLRKPLAAGSRSRLLSLLPYADARAVAPWARRLVDAVPAKATHADVVAALQVLCALRDPVDHDRLAAATRHPDPDVRLAAAIALGEQAAAADAAHFLPLLADRGWAVRQAAAEALANLPGLAPGELAALAADVFDRYGREALQLAMADRRG